MQYFTKLMREDYSFKMYKTDILGLIRDPSVE